MMALTASILTGRCGGGHDDDCFTTDFGLAEIATRLAHDCLRRRKSRRVLSLGWAKVGNFVVGTAYFETKHALHIFAFK